MKDQLPALTESPPTAMSRSLIPPRIEQRAAIVALSRAGISPSIIAAFTQTHPRTVRRWICRVKQGHPLTDRPRCGRPRTYGQASRLMTIAVYCQHAPPLPGVLRWSLRDAERYFQQHPESVGGPLTRC